MEIIDAFSSLLQRVIVVNESLHDHQGKFVPSTIFDAFHKPNVSVYAYLKRFSLLGDCSPPIFVVSYVYLDRLMSYQPAIRITSFNVHRLILTSVLLSAKFLEYGIFGRYVNPFLANVGGISTKEINILEQHFLNNLKFDLFVKPETFATYCKYLVKERMLCDPRNAMLPPLHIVKPMQFHHVDKKQEIVPSVIFSRKAATADFAVIRRPSQVKYSSKKEGNNYMNDDRFIYKLWG